MPESQESFVQFSVIISCIAVAIALLNTRLLDWGLSTVVVFTTMLLFILLIRHGREEAFATWLRGQVDFSPSEGDVWVQNNDREPSERPFHDAILDSFPSGFVLILIAICFLLIHQEITGAEFSNQVYGLMYDLVGGALLVIERVRTGPYQSADTDEKTRGLFESIWGFGLIATGFLIQIVGGLS